MVPYIGENHIQKNKIKKIMFKNIFFQVIAQVQTFAFLAPGSSFLHGSQTELGHQVKSLLVT